MKRILSVIITFIMALIIVPASAHPGRTDSSGGHTDRSAGQYHYHHGYSAHQHTNGICPYDFDDKTGINSGSSGISSGIAKPSVLTTKEPITTVKQTHSDKTDGNGSFKIFLIVVIISVFAIYYLYGFFKEKYDAYKWKRRTACISDIPRKAYQLPILIIPKLEYGGIPDDIHLTHDFLPYVSKRLNGYGKRYNAYVNKNGYCYHRTGCEYLNEDKQLMHVYHAIDSSYLIPCSKCKPRIKKDKWYTEMFPNEKFSD